MKIAYIGDKPEKKWTSPITRRLYHFEKRGGAKCPNCEVENQQDIAKLISHDDTFDLYERVLKDNEYFPKLENRKKAKKEKLAKERRDAAKVEKVAGVGEVENIVNEMMKPLGNVLSNLEIKIKSLEGDMGLIKSGIAALQKK